MPNVLHRSGIPLFDRSQRPSSIPARFSTISACHGSLGWLRGWSISALSLAVARTMLSGTVACYLGVLLTLGVPSIGRAEAESRSQASVPSNLDPVAAYVAFITEASGRFAVPERWIRAVIQVESGGNAQATSPKGALGLMQIMPETWVELSVRYDLGINPFDPHNNITAGTAYLREMLDRFGPEGFLAAYNAGPKRYEEHLTTGRPLPDETRTYVARLVPLIGIKQRERGVSVTEWEQAPVFVQRSDGSSAGSLSAVGKHFVSSFKHAPSANVPTLVPRSTRLFVPRTNEVHSR